jgi:hypothetical protein
MHILIKLRIFVSRSITALTITTTTTTKIRLLIKIAYLVAKLVQKTQGETRKKKKKT